MLIRVIGGVLGTLAAWLVADGLPLGRGIALAGPVFAAVLLLTALVAQRFAPRPGPAGPRSASLAIRSISDHLPRFPAHVAAVSTVVLIALLTGTTYAAVPDSEGRLGRAFTRVCDTMGGTASPWPGSYYSLPILVATGVCLGLALLALRAVTRRPRLAGDEGARRRTAEIIVSGYSIAVLTPLAGCAVVTAGALDSTLCGKQRLIAAAAAVGAMIAVVFWIYMTSVLLFGRRERS
jgi:hypothetical protein